MAALLLALLTAVGFYYLVISDLNAVPKFIAVIILLVACSFSIQKLIKVEGEYGLLLFRTKKGLEILNRLARARPKLWRSLAEFGTVMGFGLFSVFIFRRQPKSTLLLSMLFLLVFSQFILPFAGPLAAELLNIDASKQVISVPQAAASGDGLLAILVTALFYSVFLSLIAGGLALAGIAGLVINALRILAAVAAFLLALAGGVSDGGALAGVGPGAAPVLPGINLPFVEGVLALAVLLIVHESAHGILACVEGIPLRSAGLVFLGILPIGAFIDPDEKKLQKAEFGKQSRVLAAGSTANLVTAIGFFALLLIFQAGVLLAFPTDQLGTAYVEVTGTTPGAPADGIIKAGMRITGWRGHSITQISDFVAAANGTNEGDPVQIATDQGTFTMRAGKGGKVGVSTVQRAYSFSSYVRDLSLRGAGWLGFLFNFIALTFILNVLVGIVNLLPIPAFDGYRIAYGVFGEKRIFGVKAMDALVALVAGAFLANLLPWLWA